MQIFLIISFMLILISPVGQALAAPDNPTPASGVTQKKPTQGNSTDKVRKGNDKTGGEGVVSGFGVGASTNSPSSVSVSPGVAVRRDGRAPPQGKEKLPDPRSAQ